MLTGAHCAPSSNFYWSLNRARTARLVMVDLVPRATTIVVGEGNKFLTRLNKGEQIGSEWSRVQNPK